MTRDDAPVPLMQREREFTELLELYREEQPRSVLEIGIGHGGSLFYWLRDARDDVPVLVVAVDTFDEFDERWRFDDWVPLNVQLEIVKGRSTSADVAARVLELRDRFDWVFIDGDHSYEVVLADWLLYGARARTCVFHDIVSDAAVHPEIEVGLLWDELKRDHVTREIVDDAHASWGGLGVVWPTGSRPSASRTSHASRTDSGASA